MNAVKSAILLSISTIALAACAQNNPLANTGNNSVVLDQYHWKLQSATNQTNQALTQFYAGQQQPNVTVDFSDGRLSIHGSCNRLGSSYTLKGKQLKADRFMSTMMACPEPAMKQDGAMASFFNEQVLTYNIQQQATPVLSITNSKGETLRFVGETTAETKYGSNPETIFLAVSHKKQACTSGVQKHDCLLVKEVRFNENGLKTHEDKNWTTFHDQIEGFTHRADTDTVLRIKRFTRQNVPADASKYAYVLDMVVEQAMVK